MHKRLLLLLLVVIGSSYSLIAQSNNKGKVIGTVNTTDQQPLSFATVVLKDTRYGTMANENGEFSIEAPAGKYTLEITYAHYVVSRQPVTLTRNEETKVGVITVESPSNQLKEVIVADIQTNKFGNKESISVARMPISNLENPQVYSVIPKELIQEQVAIDYNSAMKSVPGAVVTNGVNDSGNDVVVRGFRVQSNYRNGLAGDPRTQIEIVNLERVEVLKGPSGTLFGGAMAGYGGVVNNVTKKPFESYRGEVSYTTGSWGLNRLTVDLNTPLNKDRTALMRVNVAGHMENSFQNQGYQRNFALATSMSFKPNDRTTVRFDADIYSPEKPLIAYIRTTTGLTAKNITELNLPFDRSLASNDIGARRFTANFATEVEYRLSSHWTSRTSFLHTKSSEKDIIFFVPFYLNNNQIQRRFRIFEDYQIDTDNFQQNFTGDFQLGRFKNRMVAGVDYFGRSNSGQEMNPFFQIYDTVAINAATWAPLSRFQIEQYRAKRSLGVQSYSSFYQTYGAYVSDVINITDKLMAMLSLRLDHFYQDASYSNGVSANNAYGQTFLSPKLGLVYEPIKDQVSIFANYLNAFKNQGSSMGLSSASDDINSAALRNWKAEEANQWEIGVKTEAVKGKLSATVSYYNITVKNRLREITSSVYVQDGTQNSKGFEIDLIANPVRGWNIVAGYGYNDNEYVIDTDGNRGKRAPWTPVNVFNFWTSYKFLDGKAKGLGAGFGVNYVGETYFDVNETFGIPAYTLVNATAFYDQPKYRLGVKLNNVANIHYWDFFGKYQKPRELVVSVSYKF